MWEMIATLDLVDRLPAVRCPAVVVSGAEDGNAPVSAGRQIADLIPGATLREVPGAGHFPPLEAPEMFNEVLRTFLAGV